MLACTEGSRRDDEWSLYVVYVHLYSMHVDPRIVWMGAGVWIAKRGKIRRPNCFDAPLPMLV